jgi:hypothetical protein
VIRLPAPAPDRLLAMPRLSAPRFGKSPTPRKSRVDYKLAGDLYSRDEVIAAAEMDKFLEREEGERLRGRDVVPEREGPLIF